MKVSNERKIEKIILKDKDIQRITEFFQAEYKEMSENEYKSLEISFKTNFEKEYSFKNEEKIDLSLIENYKILQINYRIFSEKNICN